MHCFHCEQKKRERWGFCPGCGFLYAELQVWQEFSLTQRELAEQNAKCRLIESEKAKPTQPA